MHWYTDVLKKYTVFDGRAGRQEYWMFTLFNVLIIIAIGIVEGALEIDGYISALYMLGVLLPSLGVSIRRLHDTSHSGWWLLLSFIPFVGAIILLVFMILDSTPDSNKYGANPKGVQPAAAPVDTPAPASDPMPSPSGDNQNQNPTA